MIPNLRAVICAVASAATLLALLPANKIIAGVEKKTVRFIGKGERP